MEPHQRRVAGLSKGKGINLNKTPAEGSLNFMPEAFDSTLSLLPGASL
jgi:hypothetical protein